MQYAYAYQLNGTQAGGLDPSAKAYINAVVAAGATVTSTQRTAINNFVKGEKAGSRWTLLKRMYLPIWGLAAPNAICMTSLTSGTFNGGVTHASGYVNSNGTTGYFLFDQAPASLGLTTSSGSVYALVTANSAFSANTVLGRTQDGNNTRTGFFGAVQISSAVSQTYSDADSRCIVIGSRTSTTTTSAYTRKSTGFATVINEGASLVGAVGTVQPMTYMAWNNNGTISSFSPSTVRFGSYGMGLGMTSTQAENFSAGLKTLWETCTGLSLP
jgi:hypothetical protein